MCDVCGSQRSPSVLWAHTLDLAARLGVRGPRSAAPEASTWVELSPCLALGAKARLKLPAVPPEPTCPVPGLPAAAELPLPTKPGSAPPGGARGGAAAGWGPLLPSRPDPAGAQEGNEVPEGGKERKRKKST